MTVMISTTVEIYIPIDVTWFLVTYIWYNLFSAALANFSWKFIYQNVLFFKCVIYNQMQCHSEMNELDELTIYFNKKIEWILTFEWVLFKNILYKNIYVVAFGIKQFQFLFLNSNVDMMKNCSSYTFFALEILCVISKSRRHIEKGSFISVEVTECMRGKV